MLDVLDVLCRQNSTDAASEDDIVGAEEERDAIRDSPAPVHMDDALAVVAHARDDSVVARSVR